MGRKSNYDKQKEEWEARPTSNKIEILECDIRMKEEEINSKRYQIQELKKEVKD